MSTIAIITARGGSRRIPGKNIRSFCGKPIIAYSIGAALGSGVFDEVMVSTDSAEIRRVAEEYGASVPFLRSARTSNDYATTADVLREVLAEYGRRGKKFDWFCCLYPTAPFVTAGRLRRAAELLQETEEAADALMTVVPFSFPPQRAVVIRKGMVQYQYPEFAAKRSQDLEKIYHDCGQFYYVRTETFLQEGTVVPERTVPMILPAEEVQDIDNESDWILAEVKFRTLQRRREAHLSLRKVTEADSQLLYDWRNEAAVRKASFHQEPISFEQHTTWFAAAMENPEISMWIMEEQGADGEQKAPAGQSSPEGQRATAGERTPVGQVRVRRVEGKYEISYSIDRGFRGRGYGRAILHLLEAAMQETARVHSGGAGDRNGSADIVLVGEVRKENAASRAVFRSLGYEETEAEDRYRYRKDLSSPAGMEGEPGGKASEFHGDESADAETEQK